MFSLIKPTEEVGAEEAPIGGTGPALKYHAHEGIDMVFWAIGLN